MRKLCRCLEQVELLEGRPLFVVGERARGMDFITEGYLKYFKESKIVGSSCSPKSYIRLSVGCWVSEPVLWLDVWEHRGHLVASTRCTYIRVDAQQFQSEMHEISELRKYAEVFCNHANQQIAEHFGDVCVDGLFLEELFNTAIRHR